MEHTIDESDPRPNDLAEALAELRTAEGSLQLTEDTLRELEKQRLERWRDVWWFAHGIRVGSVIDVPGEGECRVSDIEGLTTTSPEKILRISVNVKRKDGKWSQNTKSIYPGFGSTSFKVVQP